jgi:hypothetical protein
MEIAIKRGELFRGILNDLKRRPEDAAKELKCTSEEINDIIIGKIELTDELIEKAVHLWPINKRDFHIIEDDCPEGVIIFRKEDSEKTSRIMQRGGKPYYEYRDTAMSKLAPFRPEWIKELCVVEDNDPNNETIQWNKGHFMQQFTYFIGPVNFYYLNKNGEKKVAVMNTGDSMYITPFVPHTFATRKNELGEEGLILALTYGNKLCGDAQHELSAIGISSGSQYVLDFSSREKGFASLLKYHRQAASIGHSELSRRSEIDLRSIIVFENGESVASDSEMNQLANALNINKKELLPPDSMEDSVVVQPYASARRWFFPDDSRTYEMVELSSTPNLPFSKAFEINILKDNNVELDLKAGLHQYGYNLGLFPIELNWEVKGKNYSKTINSGDTFYMKPFVQHSFRGKGKVLVLRVGGKIVGEPQRELSLIGKVNVERVIGEKQQWFKQEEESNLHEGSNLQEENNSHEERKEQQENIQQHNIITEVD